MSEVSIASSFHQVGVVSSCDPQCSEARGRAPSQPAAPTKYLINGRNCDTISNEPFIEPHLDNPEIGSRASRVPNQRIPPQCRRRSFPPTATSTHLSFVKRSQVVTRMIRRQAGGLQPGGSSTASAPSPPWDALSGSPRNTSTKPPTSYTSENSSGNLHFTIL